VCVAYETLARRGELVALEVRDIDLHPDGTGPALIRRGRAAGRSDRRLENLFREQYPMFRALARAMSVAHV
jgi:integrase